MQPIDPSLLSDGLHADALRDLPAASIITDAQQRIVFVNSAFESLSGYGLGELLGKNCRILQGDDTDVAAVAALRVALHEGRPFRGQILNHRKDGTPFWNLLTVTPLRNAQRTVTHFVGVLLDVTDAVDRARTTAILLALAGRLHAESDRVSIAQRAAEAARELGVERSAVAVVEEQGTAVTVTGLGGWGSGTADVLRLPSVDLLGAPADAGPSDPGPRLITPDSASAWARDLLLRSGCTALLAVPVVPTDTVRGFVLAALHGDPPPDTLPPVLTDRLSRVAGLVATALENLELIEQIRRSAEIDSLTGLVTRAVAQRRIAHALALPEAGVVGVVYCGVDRFEWINDGLGHAGGDEALQRIADILRAASPPPAVVSRSSGDEFIVVLPSIDDRGEVATFVADLDQRFRTALTVQGREIYVTLSIGSAVAERGGSPGPSEATALAERTIRDADSAMYRVKQGRHGQGLEGSGAELLQLDTDLHDAVDRGEIVAYFQPQYDARIGNLTGYEALARWHHPERGSLPPDRFIPLAEADGLIARLGDQIIEQACRFADRAAAHRPLQMQVNVSVQQLSAPGLADRIRRVLAEYPDRAWSLDVEITESSLIVNHDLVRAELDQLRALGVGVSVDDFGSGYSSLSQLRDLPATELKIDRSFVHREDAVGTSLLTAILALAAGLGLTVVAEGIENRSQLATLRSLGCDRLQGMYLCPPLRAEKALTARSDIAALLAD